jgi:hypothetical protein
MATARMTIDEQMPAYDVAIAVHRVADADPETTFRAARDLDFLTVRTPLLSASMWLRGLPARLRRQPPPPLEELRLSGDGPGLPGWVNLGERSGSEVVFGAVGKFWQPTIEWRDVPQDRFASFAEPGYGKIACNFTVRPYGERRSLVSYECRVATTDARSRRSFQRYWRLIRPVVAHILRATLATIGRDATAAAVRATFRAGSQAASAGRSA